MEDELTFEERMAYEEYLEQHEEEGKTTKPMTEKQFLKELRKKTAKRYGSMKELRSESEGVLDSLDDLLGDVWSE